MTTIVARLRAYLTSEQMLSRGDNLMWEAADEIERLRAENDLLFNSINGNGADLARFNAALNRSKAR